MKQRIALVHDYLSEAGGAERVLRVLSDMYPQAPIYTAFAKRGSAKSLFSGPPNGEASRTIVESPWAPFLKIGRFYSYFRFLLPLIWKSIDLTEYDLVITSCSGYIARGFRVRDDPSTSLRTRTRVIAYCHTPPRWLYGYDTPTGAQAKWWGRLFMWSVGPFLRYFDYLSAQRVDKWIANSQEVAGRIKKFYRKKAVVVYPPIEINSKPETRNSKKENYYLMVSRIVGGKGIKEADQAAERGKLELIIVGEVVDKKLASRLKNYRGRVHDDELVALYAKAKGFIALARDEDFGMTIVESMAHGTPVLAYNGGGYKETVVPGKTGILIDRTDVKSVVAGIERMEKIKWDREAIIKWASRFGRANFEKKIQEIIKPLKH